MTDKKTEANVPLCSADEPAMQESEEPMDPSPLIQKVEETLCQNAAHADEADENRREYGRKNECEDEPEEDEVDPSEHQLGIADGGWVVGDGGFTVLSFLDEAAGEVGGGFRDGCVDGTEIFELEVPGRVTLLALCGDGGGVRLSDE